MALISCLIRFAWPVVFLLVFGCTDIGGDATGREVANISGLKNSDSIVLEGKGEIDPSHGSKEIATRESEVGQKCFIPGPNDSFNRKDQRTIVHFPRDRFATAEDFIRAIEDKCVEFTGRIEKGDDESFAEARTRVFNGVEYRLTEIDPLDQRSESIRVSFDPTKPETALKNYLNNFDNRFIYDNLYQVGYENQPGIDMGGIKRDYLDRISKDLFGFFTENDHGRLVINSNITDYGMCTQGNEEENANNCWSNIGSMVAKIPFIEDQASPFVRLSYFLLNQLFGKRMDNIEGYLAIIWLDDGVQFSSIVEMLKMSKEEISDLYLEYKNKDRSSVDLELDNIFDYLLSDLEGKLVKPEQTSFISGFHGVVPKYVLNDLDLNADSLASFMEGQVSIDSFRAALDVWGFSGSYGTQQRYKDWLIEIVQEHEDDEFVAKLLRFWTGSSAVPQRLVLSGVGNFEENLPESHTCNFEIVIPAYGYETKEKFKEKLSIAVANSDGFGCQ